MGTGKELKESRQEIYGDPKDGFACARDLFVEWEDFRNKNNVDDHEKEAALLHAVNMICMKLSRIAVSPHVKDHWDDIQGYVECAKSFMVENA